MSRRSNVLNDTSDNPTERYKGAELDHHQCKQCGTCCILHWQSFEATHNDVIRWKREGRTDILKHFQPVSKGHSAPVVSPGCPFLKKNENIYSCIINSTKPFYCKNYPDNGICEYVTDFSNDY